MGKLKCRCLNITIHAKEVLASDIDGKKFVSDGCPEDFFSSTLIEIELGVGGITKELAVLVRKHRSEDWDVFTCLNCGIKCYALHAIKGFNRVLVSKQLISDCDKQEGLSKHCNFSTAFKIILKEEKTENNGGPDTPVTLEQNSLAKSMSSVQELLKRYLKAEEAAMEERIRLYTEQQKSAFMSLKTKAFREKMSVQKVLAEVEQKSLSDSISDAMLTDGNQRSPIFQASSDTSPRTFRSFDAASHKATSTPDSMRPVHITQVPMNQQPRHKQSTGRKGGNYSSFHRHPSEMAGSTEADIMFDIEGFSSGDCEPFFESDPEDESSDTSSQPDDSILMANSHTSLTSHATSHAVYSASLPITMPALTRASRSWEDEQDPHDKVNAPPRPEKIAESMKALALSVQNQSEHMFGDLPRSRTNTYAHSHRH